MQKDRIRINKEEEFEISIRAKIEPNKQTLLILWMILWSIAGVGIVSQFFLPHPEEMTTYLFVWLAFWAYFEYKVVYAYRWRLYGVENIRITDKELLISREISRRSIPAKYEIDWIKNLRSRDKEKATFLSVMNKAYWNPGDESIIFDYKGKEIPFGMELEPEEADGIISSLSKKLESLRS